MIIISGTVDFRIGEDTVVAIGKFDGIHRGHEKLLRTMLEYKQKGLKMAVFTFDIPPKEIVRGNESKVLTTNEEKRLIFEQLDIDYLVEFPFYEKTAAISAEDFIDDILVRRMRAKAVVCGDDCRFGYKGRGNAKLLAEYGNNRFDITVVNKVFYKGSAISSTRIRELILAGDIESANEMLLMPYSIYGTVVHGKQLGRTLGMPTVNLIAKPNKLLPPFGVYYSRVKHMGTEYRSITNIGCKPTVSDDTVVSVETYLYNFDRYIYGDNLTVVLYHYSRPEQKFSGLDALKAQIQQDIDSAKEWHKDNL